MPALTLENNGGFTYLLLHKEAYLGVVLSTVFVFTLAPVCLPLYVRCKLPSYVTAYTPKIEFANAHNTTFVYHIMKLPIMPGHF